MTRKELENWLERETKAGNQLTEAFVSILKDATPEIREHYYSQLESVLNGALKASEEIKKEIGNK